MRRRLAFWSLSLSKIEHVQLFSCQAARSFLIIVGAPSKACEASRGRTPDTAATGAQSQAGSG